MTTVAFGWNQNHQLGLGDTQLRVVPQVVTALEGSVVVSVVCGSRYTVALSKEGNVYSWGRGDDNQLGLSKGGALATVPRLVQTLESVRIVSIAARGAHTLALSAEGRVYAWGRNDEGQLGLGHRDPCKTPTEISFFREHETLVTKIACGKVHSVAISRAGYLYSWGDDDDGATGLAAGEAVLEPRRLPSLSDVTDVACGSRHTLVLVDDTNVDAEITVPRYMCNQLFAFGWGTYGQLGTGERKARSEPTPVYFPAPLRATQKVRITQIACGYRHSLAVLTSFEPNEDEEFSNLFAFGWNQYGQLGVTTQGASMALEPMLVTSLPSSVLHVCGGGRHTIAVVQRDSDGAKRMFAWGRNDDGQLGAGTTFSDQTSPLRVKCFGRDVAFVAAGWSHTVAILSDRVGSPDTEEAPENEHYYVPRSPSTQFLFERRQEMMRHKNSFFARMPLGSKLAQFRELFGGVLTYGNLDAGFAQFLNTLILLLNLLSSMRIRVGVEQSLVVGKIVPGATLTVFLSNIVFGAWADLKARRAEGEDFTALPHGINTVLFFAFTMLIMAPVFEKTGDAELAYHTGLACCFVLGVLELPALFLVEHIRKVVPRAAMMSAMAGVSLTFIAMTFTVQIFSNPAVAIIPMVVILTCYGSNVQLPYKVPAGLVALVLGSIIVAVARAFDLQLMDPASEQNPAADGSLHSGTGFYLPSSSLPDVFHALLDSRTWPYITVVVPMLIVNIVTNLSCFEASEAVGDSYSIRQGLALDAGMTILGSLMGCPFPTCVYIGHGAFKSMGASGGYSYISAVAVLLLGLFNGTSAVMTVVPEVAGVGILMWIGIVVTAQAFDRDDDYQMESSSSGSHAAAVALGLLPALASWGMQYIQATVPACGTVLSNPSMGLSEVHVPFDKVMRNLEANGVYVYGLIALSRGYLLSSIFLASALVEIIDRKFFNAAAWMLVGAALSFVGAVHSFELDEHGVSSSYGFPAKTEGDFPIKYAFAYSGAAVLLLLFEIREGDGSSFDGMVRGVRHFVRRRLLGKKGRGVESGAVTRHDMAPAQLAPVTALNYTASFDADEDDYSSVNETTPLQFSPSSGPIYSSTIPQMSPNTGSAAVLAEDDDEEDEEEEEDDDPRLTF
ncbi:RCC1 and BTB domain-containing protein 1 [Hondaea fermentalgiana]|uniref:RCC1 and BTB domain-containing protein 1 n=1 Tax=Hondaea fermentalgiana TaxID=2315210 RepID=A0A2R5GKH5_9STRA|nr:RCC1 and BTB domain-containing protein 1 [Hondaea fermentalgiana]|eukprot:GBG28374.1 RCC1 and BTB domain-containing protein 1 [Hondaea fermentalgiana]